jgi:hypothetical protein
MAKAQANSSADHADIGEQLVQLGVRIPRSLHFELKSAALLQEREGRLPRTQAEIVVDAIQLWLRSHGYTT